MSRIQRMTTLRAALDSFGGPGKLARLIGVTPQAVCFWRDGLRRIPADQCYRIERAMDGLITRQQLRPDDWQDIWPELEVSGPFDNSQPIRPAAQAVQAQPAINAVVQEGA